MGRTGSLDETDEAWWTPADDYWPKLLIFISTSIEKESVEVIVVTERICISLQHYIYYIYVYNY